MTTIVADARDGVMVSDSKTTDGELKWPSKKIERIGDSLFGFAGDVVDINKVTNWLRNGRKGKKPKVKEFSALELNADGVFIWDHAAPESFSPERPFHAVGSGAMAALGALLAGRNAVEAVEIAAQIDDKSEGPIQTVRLHADSEGQ